MRRCFFISFLYLCLLNACAHRDWRTADRSSAGIAPLPEETKEAVVQVYAARAFKWRGWFAVHSWIATKEENAKHYMVYQVIGFRLRRSGTAVVVEQDLPDRKWFDAEPEILFDLRGPKAGEAIPKIQKAAQEYPHASTYRVWPGPNSNTFISFINRKVPELSVELPPTAIGKDWLPNGDLFGWSESGTGAQFSVLGALGLVVGKAEGIELNVIGLSFGLDFLRPALKLPLVGRLGMKDAPVD